MSSMDSTMGSALHQPPSCILAKRGRIEMNLLIRILQSVVFDAAAFDAMTLPAFIREEILEELFEATADAFECPSPTLDHLSYDRCLRTYALFTRVLADEALQS